MTTGIYRIINKKTGQIYIGQSSNIEQRFRKHCNAPSVDVDIAVQGKDDFIFDILEETEKDELDEREQFWIKSYNTYENEHHYNLSPGGPTCKGLSIRAKYTLWDVSKCYYQINIMFNCDREPNPCSCFFVRYYGYYIPIGGFYDFLSCEIIGDLIDKYINE